MGMREPARHFVITLPESEREGQGTRSPCCLIHEPGNRDLLPCTGPAIGATMRPMESTTQSRPEAVDEPAAATQHWIVGFDGSNHARRALEWAAETARGRPVRIEAVIAWQRPYAGILPIRGGGDTQDEILDALNEEARIVVEDVRTAKGIDLSARTELGSPAGVLLEAVEAADLLVLGSRGHGGLAQFALGSVGIQTTGHSSKPTLIVPDVAQPHGLHRTVVGVDGSDNAKAALEWAFHFAPPRTEIVALHSWAPPLLAADYLGAQSVASLSDEASAEFEAAVMEVEQRVGAPGRFVRSFATGHVGGQLIAAAEHADLLVIGARGRSGLFSGLGSMSTWILHHMVCPTAVVPAPVKAD